MIPGSRRVSRVLFEKSMSVGAVHQTRFFSLRVAPFPAVTAARCAVVVSKKVAPRATKRNAMRRRVYHALAPLLGSMKTGNVALLFAKKDAAALSAAECAHEVRALLVQVRLLES